MKAIFSAAWPFWQAFRLLTFRNGVPEAPSKFGFDFFTLLMLSASIGTARWALFHEGNTPLVMLLVYVFQGLVPLLFVPVRNVSLMVLCLIGTDIVGTVLNFAGLHANTGLLYYGLLAWGIIAYISASRPLRPSKPNL